MAPWFLERLVGHLSALRTLDKLQVVYPGFSDNRGWSGPFSSFMDEEGNRAYLPQNKTEREKERAGNAKYRVWETREDHSCRTERWKALFHLEIT